MSRIAKRFADLREQNRAGFVPFVTAGDPDAETSFALFEKLPESGADLVELGMPFSDPMADGPAIQASSMRALKAGMTVERTLAMVTRFRERDAATPVVLMGYYNPVHAYGVERFAADAARAGVDGLIIVDLPPEEDSVLRVPASAAGIDIVRLATPTTDEARLPAVLDGASGFLYYVSITGVTGTKAAVAGHVREAMQRIKKTTALPVAVGFGIRTPEDAAAVARQADAAVVGSAIVAKIAAAAASGAGRDAAIADTLSFCRSLADAVHAARAGV